MDKTLSGLKHSYRTAPSSVPSGWRDTEGKSGWRDTGFVQIEHNTTESVTTIQKLYSNKPDILMRNSCDNK